MKILKSQGTSYADVAIPYYSPTDTHKEADRIEKLDGTNRMLLYDNHQLHRNTQLVYATRNPGSLQSVRNHM